MSDPEGVGAADGGAGEDHLSLHGDLATASVPGLLAQLAAARESGVLSLRQGRLTKTLLLHEGRVAFATSNDPDERLGELLLVAGEITARHYVEASRLIAPGRKLGAILVELGALEPEELLPALEEQVRAIALGVMPWTWGEYEFVWRELDDEQRVGVGLAADQLILDGVRSIRSWSRVAQGIGWLQRVPAPAAGPEAAYRYELSEEEQQVLAAVNGRSSVEQICSVSFLSSFETCRLLWALQLLGLVRWVESGETAGVDQRALADAEVLDLESVVERFNQMFNRVYVFLRGRLGEGADAFMDSVMRDVAQHYPALFEGVDLRHYGRADFEQMLANVADLPLDERRRLMLAGLNEVVYAILLGVKRTRGAQEEAVVSGLIKEGFRRLGSEAGTG